MPEKKNLSFPKRIKSWLRSPYYTALEIGERLLGVQDDLTPPRRLRAQFVSSIAVSDFKKTGQDFLRYFTELCRLKPDERVLEIGSGCGRIAVPLAGFLSAAGAYEGLEIVAEGVKWCQAKITPRFPYMRFRLADVYNRHYHPQGRHLASQYPFPYDDSSFDFVFLTSVFTHMLPGDLEHYLTEIYRVLRPGGRSLITYFLWNEEAETLAQDGKSSFDFSHQQDIYRTVDLQTPEIAICYPEDFILGLYEKIGFTVRKPPYYGQWCGRQDYLSGQDIIVASKGPPAG